MAAKFPPKALEKIIALLNRAMGPVYMGIFSTEVGTSLNKTHEMVEHLVGTGVIRRCNEDDIRRWELRSDAEAYILVGRPHPAHAGW